MNPDDARELRSRALAAEALLATRAPADPTNKRRYVGQVFNGGSMPSAYPRYYLTHPVTYSGNEAEGVIASRSVDTTTSVPVAVFGRVPSVGDILQAHLIGALGQERWVADRVQGSGTGTGSGGGIGTVPFCYCTAVPETLAMVSGSSTCNYGMFQSCTIQYQPVPAAYANLALGEYAFISNESFADELSGGAIFQYFLNCLYNQYTLTRIYATSPYGSPYIDGILYSWFVGASGNTCGTGYLHLNSGTGFSFTGEPCSVTIDGGP